MSIPTENGSGSHDHVGMLLNEAEYVAFLTGGACFITPMNPGLYPTVVNLNDPVERAQQVVEHKQEMIKFKTYLGAAQSLHNKIESTIDPEWLESIHSPTLAFTHLSPKQMLDCLHSKGIKLNDMDIAELIEEQLLKKNITPQPPVHLALAKAAFQTTSEYKIMLKAFELKPLTTQMVANFHTFIVTKYSRHFKNDHTKAKSVGFGIANQAITTQKQLSKEEMHKAKMALALNKIVQNVQAASNKKMEAFMDFTKDMLKQFLAASKSNNTGENSITTTNVRARVHRCTHCKCFHPKIPDEKCWNLAKTVASCPKREYVTRMSGNNNED
ncbi:hypothetical protein ACHAW6_005786 [Cyclotella cf. meneghiniana]